ncbi:hypothetical protein F7731_24285 [Cytobacillus depressus]|uniref:HEAT repeat domain-containing protein n=1 Tax=Cytobacillus depressus TaxID=1602942 RepID=A0A6L3UXB2_9BACI|nr:hypothetical protein [Cytobacillus depressus]KAB2328748.1 hypothetical protein F7731_24285 [Cytobacillus depressus]
MELSELEQILKGNNLESKIETISHLSDVFESYNKDIANFDDLVVLLLKFAIEEQNNEVKEELFDTLLDAATYKNTEKINWDILEQHINELPSECIPTAISILGLSHNKKYAHTLSTFSKHENKSIKSAALIALSEFE